MFYKLRNNFHKWNFNRVCANILKTPPLTLKKSGPLLVSMVCHADIIMYLLSAKSFLNRLGMGRIVVINDGSLTEADKKLISHHISPLQIIPIKDISTHQCPTGGTWERLLHILDLSEKEYVIQLDSDTLTLKPIPEIIRAVEENRPFLLGTVSGLSIEPISKVVDLMKKTASSHVQAQAEMRFDQLNQAESLQYCRACSGFAGFGKGLATRESLVQFSTQMEKILAQKWHEWGSEQVSSNFILSNSKNTMVLPYPDYSEFKPKKELTSVRFLHFIGNYRWHNGTYLKMGKGIIKELLK